MASVSGFLETNGARIWYEVDGHGEPVVLVHAGIANLRMWDPQVAALSDRFRLIRYDARGYGRTETDDVAYSDRDDIAALLDHVAEPSAHVVGLSRGAMVALDFAVERPERVRSLVFGAGGVAGFVPQEEEDPAIWEQVERWTQTRDWEALSAWEAGYWVNGPGQRPDRADPAILAQVRDWILSNYRAGKVAGRQQPLEPAAGRRLDALRAPLLVLVGDLDEAVTRWACRELATVVPGARLEVFQGAAHLLNLEEPERFTRVVAEFIEDVAARP